MIDLNDLRVFERVASLRSFSAASSALELPKSSVSRSVSRLEARLGTRLLQRTTREVSLTEPGMALLERCAELLGSIEQTFEYVGSFAEEPRGCLRVSAGIGFAINVLSELLPDFLLRYPHVEIALDLSSRPADLVVQGIDVAIRMGPLPDSQIIARRLGVLNRYLCAAPEYLERRGNPRSIDELRNHDLIAMTGGESRQTTWHFTEGDKSTKVRQIPRLNVNCALTIHRMLLNGAGIGLSSGYLCVPEFESGRLIRLLPEWRPTPVEVHAVFPSRRQLSPCVGAFVDFMVDNSDVGKAWQYDPIAQREADCAKII